MIFARKERNVKRQKENVRRERRYAGERGLIAPGEGNERAGGKV